MTRSKNIASLKCSLGYPDLAPRDLVLFLSHIAVASVVQIRAVGLLARPGEAQSYPAKGIATICCHSSQL